jgi:hypothetical protein
MGSTYFSKRIPTRTYVRVRSPRPRTFKSEEAAKKWADAQGIKKYELVNLRNSESQTKKIRVIVK